MVRAALIPIAVALAASAADKKPASNGASDWPGERLPLPLSVKSPEDLAFKALVERQYLVFNLLAGGKLAYDRGEYASAAEKWETLLRLEGLDPAIDTISGGGSGGPGGAVITLKRVNGKMPKLSPATDKVINQRNKLFVPRVLAVPVGTSVIFRNEDPLAHNVFSLSPARQFDTGLYKAPGEQSVLFDKPGVVQLLCNIHSSMVGYVVVVDTPYYAQADAKGAFAIRGVIAGDYDLEIWHENASQPTKVRVSVGRDGSLTRDGNPVELTVAGDKPAAAFPLDKYGKPRQTQLGY
jgi:plastocyanin